MKTILIVIAKFHVGGAIIFIFDVNWKYFQR